MASAAAMQARFLATDPVVIEVYNDKIDKDYLVRQH